MSSLQETISPVDGSIYLTRPTAAPAEIEAALSKAVQAQRGWAAQTIAERVRASSADPVPIGSGSLVQTVSIGVATWNGRESPESLQKRADEAMYFAKQTGRNRVELAREKKTRPKANGKSALRTR